MKLLVVLFLIGYMNASQASTSSKKIETYSFEINDNTLCDIVLLNDKEYLIDLIYTFPEGRLSGHEEVNQFAAVVTPTMMYLPAVYTTKISTPTRNRSNPNPNKKFNLGCCSAKDCLSVFLFAFKSFTTYL